MNTNSGVTHSVTANNSPGSTPPERRGPKSWDELNGLWWIIPRSFRKKVSVSTSGCWEWTGVLEEGYGRYSGMAAYRFSYRRLVGPIPVGLHLDHLCRNRACVNPQHLEPVTPSENTRRACHTRLMERAVRCGL